MPALLPKWARLGLSLSFTKTGLIAGQLYCVALDCAGVEDSVIIHFHADRNPAVTPTLIRLKAGGELRRLLFSLNTPL